MILKSIKIMTIFISMTHGCCLEGSAEQERKSEVPLCAGTKEARCLDLHNTGTVPSLSYLATIGAQHLQYLA